MKYRRRLPVLLIACISWTTAAGETEPASPLQSPVAKVLELYEWRNIGPARGGRSIAVAGHPDRPYDYFFGATGGGLWKTGDAGLTWRPVTDGMIGSSSVGSVAVAQSNADIVYLGMGEGQLRSNVLQGDGVYRSDDAGASWRHVGLRNSRVVSAIRVHPDDPGIVYAAVLGDPYTVSEERGVYRSTDGGASWERILYRSARAGAIDIAINPHNPDVLYATLWEVYRRPWKLWSGGDGSGVFRSLDGGDTWKELTTNTGLPAGPLGKMALAVSPANPERLWLNIEAHEGGLYQSEDAGETWSHVNADRDLWQRSFYFMRVRAHPKDENTVFVLNFALQRSTDGGQSFTKVPTRHADVHDLWIDPRDPQRMVVADDGGASVSVNGGMTWTEQDVPTAQFYRLSTTNDFPYHVCGSQQDANSVCVPSRRPPGNTSRNGAAVYYAGGGENSYIAPHPAKTGIFFAGATNTLNRYDRTAGSTQDVHPWPYLVMGQSASTMTERWNWVFPIVFSPVPPHALYAGSQHLWRSDDEGRHWERISPDLTRAEPATLGDSGGPVVLDQDGPEIYATLHTIAPSLLATEVVWTGSDDGMIQLTKDGGNEWQNVTPPDLPEFTRISFIDASPHRRGAAFVAGNRYDLGDRRPYLWATDDFGRSWSRLDDTLPGDDFVHVVREDPVVPGLLYVGSERGVYVSLDSGQHWHSLRNNLPVTRVTGLEVKGEDMVIATHGRSFYRLDGLATLRQLTEAKRLERVRLFEPGTAYRRLIPATIDFWLPRSVRSARLEILDKQGRLVRTVFDERRFDAGPHRTSWDIRHDGATIFENMILEAPNPAAGPWAVPGEYRVRLTADGEVRNAGLRIAGDPRLGPVSQSDLESQLDLALSIRDAVSQANETVIEVRRAISALGVRGESVRPPGRQPITDLVTELEAVGNALYQTRNQSPKDKIANPIRLNDRLSGLLAAVEKGDAAPTRAHYEVFEALSGELAGVLKTVAPLLETQVPAVLQRSN